MGLKEKIVEKLKTVMDLGINMNVYDMGLIADIDINDGNVSVHSQRLAQISWEIRVYALVHTPVVC